MTDTAQSIPTRANPLEANQPEAKQSSTGFAVRIVGALVGLIVALVPVAFDQATGQGYGELIAIGLIVGPVLGMLHGEEVRVDQFRLGLAARMAILAVILGDVLFVMSLAAESTSTDGLVAGIVLIFVLGLLTVGPLMAVLTFACAVVWQVLLRVVLSATRRWTAAEGSTR